MTMMTLRELLTDLGRDPAARSEFDGDPEGFLSSHGFDLRADLLGEAIVAVSSVLPPEVAEHLSPFTIAHSPIPLISESGAGSAGLDAQGDGLDVMNGLELLATSSSLFEIPDRDVDSVVPDGGFGEGSADLELDHPSAPEAPTWDEDLDLPIEGGSVADTGAISPSPHDLDDLTGIDVPVADFGDERGVDEGLDAALIEPEDPADLDGLD